MSSWLIAELALAAVGDLLAQVPLGRSKEALRIHAGTVSAQQGRKHAQSSALEGTTRERRACACINREIWRTSLDYFKPRTPVPMLEEGVDWHAIGHWRQGRPVCGFVNLHAIPTGIGGLDA